MNRPGAGDRSSRIVSIARARASVIFCSAVICGAVFMEAPAAAQQTIPPDTGFSTDSRARAYQRGIEAAHYPGTTGWMTGGFIGGLTLGPIGAGLAWALANNSDVELGLQRRIGLTQEGGVRYAEEYQRAFAERLHQRRKRAALTGGILGTAALGATVAVVWAIAN